MFELYLGSLAIGGTLLLASLFLGKGEDGSTADHGGVEHGHGGGRGDGFEWLPVASLRFWTFFMAFFGATGTALYLLEVHIGTVATALIAAGVGWTTGVGTVLILRRLKRDRVDSAVQDKHLIGTSARVIIEIARGRTGKIRIDSGASVEDLLADTEDDAPLPIGSQVLIYAGGDDGRVMVTRPPESDKVDAP